MNVSVDREGRALLVVAHGSRRGASNDEVRRLTDALRSRATAFEWVECAFLELAEPSIPGGLESLVERGAREIVVLPYFLSAGRHVVEDIPGEIADVATRHPAVRIRQAAYLGDSAGIVSLMLEQAGSPADA